MANILNNRAFPNSRADLSASAVDGRVIGFVAPGSIANQRWNFLPVAAQPGFVTVKNRASGGVVVGVPSNEVPENPVDGHVFEVELRGGGTDNKFVIRVTKGGILICLPGVTGGRPDLYWTLTDNALRTPIKLMPLRDANTVDTQIWDLDHAV